MGPNGALVSLQGAPPILLVTDRVTIGRDPRCTVCLDFQDVSRKHCELTREDGWWYITDLDSKNGIKVNGVRLKRKLLAPKDAISIGTHRFIIAYIAPTSASRRGRVGEDELVWEG